MLQNSKISTIELMRVTSSDKLENMHPNVVCHKCGKKQWVREAVPLTWSCIGCGNQVFIELGRPKQQIDVLMQSYRNQEFKQTERGTIIPCLGLIET